LLALVAVKLEFYADLVFVCLASWVIRYLLLPKLEVRYLLPQAAILGIVAAGAAFRPKVVIPQYPEPEVSFASPQAIHD
jgi:hypothetical protein